MDEPAPHLPSTRDAAAPLVGVIIGVIDAEEVERIAALAHLTLSPDDIVRYTRELDAILGYVKQLDEVDVSEVVATAQVGAVSGEPHPPAWLRRDTEGTSLQRDVVLREAPKVAMAGFAVPSFADDEA